MDLTYLLVLLALLTLGAVTIFGIVSKERTDHHLRKRRRGEERASILAADGDETTAKQM